jgi:hypothetical protein
MSAQLQWRALPVPAGSVPAKEKAPAATKSSGRLVAAGVAIYLLPALAVVAVASAIGAMFLAAGRLVAGFGVDREPRSVGEAGLEAIRA